MRNYAFSEPQKRKCLLLSLLATAGRWLLTSMMELFITSRKRTGREWSRCVWGLSLRWVHSDAVHARDAHSLPRGAWRRAGLEGDDRRGREDKYFHHCAHVNRSAECIDWKGVLFVSEKQRRRSIRHSEWSNRKKISRFMFIAARHSNHLITHTTLVDARTLYDDEGRNPYLHL